MYKNHTTCRACGYGSQPLSGIKAANTNEKLIPVFDLGIQPPANSFLQEHEEHPGFAPLKVMLCPRCSLAQLSVVVDPMVLYSSYHYVTSRSLTLKRHIDWLWEQLNIISKVDSVLEVGSNDGQVLLQLSALGAGKVVGVDPARNLSTIANASGVTSYPMCFGPESAEIITKEHGRFSLVLARHVFCHIDNWKEFVAGLDAAVSADGMAAIEIPHAHKMLENGEFDTIYHEHLSYFNLGSMSVLLRNTPFSIIKAIPAKIHGGSLVVILKRGDQTPESKAEIGEAIAMERVGREHWKAFEARVAIMTKELDLAVRGFRASGDRVVGFGASAKSTVWVNHLKWSREQLDCITDTTKSKWYRLSPGTDIPIIDEGYLLREDPDYAVCFAWNFRDDVIRATEVWRRRGGKILFPVPKLEVVS